jgi:hypothetical protein
MTKRTIRRWWSLQYYGRTEDEAYIPRQQPQANARRGTATRKQRSAALSNTARFCIRSIPMPTASGRILLSMVLLLLPYSCADSIYVSRAYWVVTLPCHTCSCSVYKIVSFRIGRQIHPRAKFILVPSCVTSPPVVFILPTNSPPFLVPSHSVKDRSDP